MEKDVERCRIVKVFLDACDTDIVQTFSRFREANENGALSIVGEHQDWWAHRRHEAWMWRSGGLTAPWPRADERRSGATPIPPQTTRTAGCPRRSLTVPAKPWKLSTTTPPGCFTETEWRIWSTGKPMSTPDKVGHCSRKTGCWLVSVPLFYNQGDMIFFFFSFDVLSCDVNLEILLDDHIVFQIRGRKPPPVTMTPVTGSTAPPVTCEVRDSAHGHVFVHKLKTQGSTAFLQCLGSAHKHCFYT